MKVYIVSAGYSYEGDNIISVFDSEDKAKKFCHEEYGIDYNDWTFSDWNNSNQMKDEYFFYDPINKTELKTHYTDFKITVKKIQ